jgi:hypothetical protein
MIHDCRSLKLPFNPAEAAATIHRGTGRYARHNSSSVLLLDALGLVLLAAGLSGYKVRALKYLAPLDQRNPPRAHGYFEDEPHRAVNA